MNGNLKNILVVDDDPRFCKLMEGFLGTEGYRVTTAFSGEEALDKLEIEPTDLVLLDINMPGVMNGFEALEMIRGRRDEFIPVIILTGLDQHDHYLESIKLGADEYITKPADSVVLLTRIRNLLRIKELNDRLKDSLEQLKGLERSRQDLMDMLAHDMRNILTSARGHLKMLNRNLSGIGKENRLDLFQAMENLNELISMVSNLMDVSCMEDDKLTPNFEEVELSKLIQDVVLDITPLAFEQNKRIKIDLPEKGTTITADRDLLKRTLANLIGNAVKFSKSNKEIKVKSRFKNGYTEVEVIDHGPGIPADIKDTIFQKFAGADVKRNGYRIGRGLGLTFCKIAVDIHEGNIQVNSKLGKGSTFSFQIPTRQNNREIKA